MQNFTTALKAEHIKTKGTGFYLLSIILGAFTPLLYATVLSFVKEPNAAAGVPANYFMTFFREAVNPFAGFFFPLLIIIVTSRIAQLDHRNGGWQLMETQPIEKWKLYFAKFTVVLISNLIAILSFILVGMLAAWAISYVVEYPKNAIFEIPWVPLLQLASRLFVAALMLTALQFMIAVLIPSFIWAIVIGFVGLLLYLFLSGFKVTPDWYPYDILSRVASHPEGSELGYWFTYTDVVSILLGTLLLYIGFQWYRHKKIGRAFFGKPSRTISLAVVLLIFGGLTWYMLIPNTLMPYSETVLGGKISSDMNIQNAYLIDRLVGDTIATMPIKDGIFHGVIKRKLPLDSYFLILDNAVRQEVILSDRDSLDFDIELYNRQAKMKILGTRLAENQYQAEKEYWDPVEYYLQNKTWVDQPERFTDALVSEWKDKMKASNKFKTIDNYIPRKDFLDKNKKILTIRYINHWNSYLKLRDLQFPGKETAESADIKEMKAMVPFNDESLLGDENYFNYVRSSIVKNNKEDLDENTKGLLAIKQMPAGTFRDKMLYWQLNKSVKEAATSDERSGLMAEYSPLFGSANYRANTVHNYKIAESLSKGKPAPIFEALALNGQKTDLSQLKGKFVAIDVWATWCGPCRQESPQFERIAIKYKNQPVHFVAASMDSKPEPWIMEAKTKSKSVLQLWLTNSDAFSNAYNIEGIPRFILIDPQGNLVNAEMPRPSEANFEKLLRDALGLEGAK